MGIGFMGRRIHSIVVLLLLACARAAAAEVALIGVIGDKAVVLAVDGGEPKTVKLGQTWNGIKVLAVDKTQATVEVDGQKRVLQIGQHYRNPNPPAPSSAPTLTPAST